MNLLQTFVQLPANFQHLIVFLLTLGVSFILLQLANIPALKWLADYLGNYKVGIVTWLSGLVFNLLQNALNSIPATWDSVLTVFLQLIVEVAIVLLGFAGYRRLNFRGANALR